MRHEVDIYMCMGNSLNVATLYDVFEDDTRVHLIMEHCGGGELWKRIRKHDYTELGTPPLSVPFVPILHLEIVSPWSGSECVPA